MRLQKLQLTFKMLLRFNFFSDHFHSSERTYDLDVIPGPLKCLCAPSNQILVKSAPQKRVIATKLISRQKCKHLGHIRFKIIV